MDVLLLTVRLFSNFRYAVTMPSCCGVRECSRSYDLRSAPSELYDKSRRQLWLQHCRKGVMNHARIFICMRHFSKNQTFTANGKEFLKTTAVPDQHLPG